MSPRYGGVGAAWVENEGYRCTIYRGRDGVPVVEIDGQAEGASEDDAAKLRVYVNDGQVYGEPLQVE